MSARIGSVWKWYREFSGVLVGKEDLVLKQRGKIYRYCVRPVMLYCCETREFTVNDPRLHGVQRCMISMVCGVIQVERMSTDVLRYRVGVAVTIKVIIKSHLRWYGHIIRQDINSQICEVNELEITRKIKKDRPRKLWDEFVKKDLERYGLR